MSLQKRQFMDHNYLSYDLIQKLLRISERSCTFFALFTYGLPNTPKNSQILGSIYLPIHAIIFAWLSFGRCYRNCMKWTLMGEYPNRNCNIRWNAAAKKSPLTSVQMQINANFHQKSVHFTFRVKLGVFRPFDGNSVNIAKSINPSDECQQANA